ncbi:MAG: hypothetical protein JSV44_04715 [Candidatus Zixiibacteriota bacterium]|nr:MAG: hypothetical protein JSV44_04715 [candidate division Zixibacteria bacterium]
MTTSIELTKRWVLLGIIFGILANAVFISISIQMEEGALPPKFIYSLAWSFGPMVIVAGMGLYHFLLTRGESVRLQLAKMFMVFGGVCVTIVITVRGVALYEFPGFKPEATDRAAIGAWNHAYKAIMLTQRGVELAWGIFIYMAVILFASAIFAHRTSGKIIGTFGMTIGLLGLFFDFIIWPADPESAGLVNMGPFVGFWFIAVAIMMAVQYKKLGSTSE